MWRPFRALLFPTTSLILHPLAQDTNEDNPAIETTPGDTDFGAFVFPRTYPLTLQEGSTVNVSWSTTLDIIELYCIHETQQGARVLTSR